MSCRSWRRRVAVWGGTLLVGVGVSLTPTDTPVRAQSPGYPSGEVAEAIASAAWTYGVPEGRLRCLAWRESRFWPWAYNPAGPYHGIYQYDDATWSYGSRLAGFAGASPYDAWAAAHTTALLIARGEGSRWPPLRWC